jgi:hypothetical protein
MVQWSISDELERMWKEDGIASFEILSWHLSGGTEKNHTRPESG